MTKFYTVTKDINGKTYKAQFNGISAALDAVDDSYIDGTDNISTKKLAKYLFENVVVDPKVQIDDFGFDKIGEEQKKTINGVEYTAKFKGLSVALSAVDDCYIDGSNNISTKKLAKYLFDNIIVKPENLSMDDFENMDEFNEVVAFAREVMQGGKAMDEFNEVVAFAREVMQGNFRDKTEQKSTNKTSKR